MLRFLFPHSFSHDKHSARHPKRSNSSQPTEASWYIRCNVNSTGKQWNESAESISYHSLVPLAGRHLDWYYCADVKPCGRSCNKSARLWATRLWLSSNEDVKNARYAAVWKILSIANITRMGLFLLSCCRWKPFTKYFKIVPQFSFFEITKKDYLETTIYSELELKSQKPQPWICNDCLCAALRKW